MQHGSYSYKTQNATISSHRVNTHETNQNTIYCTILYKFNSWGHDHLTPISYTKHAMKHIRDITCHFTSCSTVKSHTEGRDTRHMAVHRHRSTGHHSKAYKHKIGLQQPYKSKTYIYIYIYIQYLYKQPRSKYLRLGSVCPYTTWTTGLSREAWRSWCLRNRTICEYLKLHKWC